MTAAIDGQTAERDYFRLLALGESPQGRLRQPGNDWTVEEQVAACVLDLLRLIHAAIWTHGPAAAPFLASLTPEQVGGYHGALQALGATKQIRLLGLLHRRLVAPFTNVEPSQRQSLIADRLDNRNQLFWRAWYKVDPDELQRHLCAYLDAAPGNPLPPLPPHEAPHAAGFPSPPVPLPLRQLDRGPGRHHLFLLRTNAAAEDAINSWILRQPQTRRYYEGHSELLTGTSVVLPLDDAATMRGPLFGVVRDPEKSGSEAPASPSDRRTGAVQRDSPAQELLDALAKNFHWVLIEWDILPGERILAWLSDDDDLAAQFDTLLYAHHDTALIGSHRGFDRLDDCARGLCFGEDDAFGEVALIAAEGEREAPWLVAAVHESSGHWWRGASAMLPSLTWHWTRSLGQNLAIVVYRGTDPGAWRMLWSHIDRDDNIATIAVGGELPLDVLRERLVHIKDFISVDNLHYLAGEEGWAYAHAWGGGSDEHVALFFASDPAVTARVAAFARERWPESWRWHGCW
ncbi:MAG: hypothetical protein J0H86_03635 [Xanthomonadaceae bacterium]|nr:hypothetical protein [Xanthomonadaceae bacterium]ODU30868.1 MAG: hypothetical protein ABS97_21415 [Xanthomonadaceae bacterium SCN 69-320]